jgi:hypothetical protein
MVKNATRGLWDMGDLISLGGDGTPHHVDMWYDKSVQIWWTDVLDKDGFSFDLRTETGPDEMYHGDSGSKRGALIDAKRYAKWHDIPVYIYASGKHVQTIKPEKIPAEVLEWGYKG